MKNTIPICFQPKLQGGLSLPATVLVLVCAAIFTMDAVKARDASFIGTFRMGERVQVGPLVYQVLESDWRSELGSGGRTPKDRYLFVKMSITNSSGSPVSRYLASRLKAADKTYSEVIGGHGQGGQLVRPASQYRTIPDRAGMDSFRCADGRLQDGCHGRRRSRHGEIRAMSIFRFTSSNQFC